MSEAPPSADDDARPTTAFAFNGHDKLLGSQLRYAYIVLRRRFAARVEPLGLTQTQCAALWLIDANPRIAQADLAALLMLDRVTMVEVTEKLARHGLVRRERSSQDGRRRDLLLTKKGATLFAKARAEILALDAELSGLFSEGELLVLLERLKRIAEPR